MSPRFIQTKHMKILLCAGTRPNFVKIAPLYTEAIKQGIDVKILHTGQHYDFSLNQVFFDQLGLPKPDIQLEAPLSQGRQYVDDMATLVKDSLSRDSFDYALTVGDVYSTLGSTLGCRAANIPVAHVEAGLRSHDERMPEEANRLEVDRIADFKFISEPDGVINLKIAGLYNEKTCFLVGNVVIDNLLNNMSKIDNAEMPSNLVLPPKSYILTTLHRPSNVDEKERVGDLLRFLDDLSKTIKIVLPLHPRTKLHIEEFGLTHLLKKIIVVEPLGYFQFLHLLKNSKFIITDSGGAQEESSILNIPCITIRCNTERPITILKGTSVLAGEDIRLLDYYTTLAMEGRLTKQFNYELWDGKASERILNILKDL